MTLKGNYDFKYRFGDFSKGISDNPFLSSEGHIVSSFNADLRNVLPDTGKNDALGISFTTLGEMYCGVDEFFFGENGYGYNTSGTNILHATTILDYEGCAKYDGKYIIFEGDTNPKISKIDVSDAIGSTDFTLEPSWVENRLPTNWSTIRKTTGDYGVSTIVFQGNLYFSNDDQVIILDSAGTTSVGLICPSTVVGMTVYGSRLKVYCEDGQILFWSGLEDTSWDEAIDLGQNIFSVVGGAGIDYIFGGRNNQGSTYLYKMNGYSLSMVKKGSLSAIQSNPSGPTGQHNMLYYNSVLHFPGGGLFDGIYTYGQAFEGMPYGLSYDYNSPTSSTTFRDTFMIHERHGTLYVSYKDNVGTKGIATISGSNTSSYIVTQALGDRMSKYDIGALEIRARGRVVISYKKDRQVASDYSRANSATGWTTWIDTNNYDYDGYICRITGQGARIPSFRDIQFKIEFYGTFGYLDVYGNYANE